MIHLGLPSDSPRSSAERDNKIEYYINSSDMQMITSHHESSAPVLLVTGFGPFENYPENPSGLIAQAVDGQTLWGTRVVGRQIEVTWRNAWPTIRAAVEEVVPTALVCLGVCPDPFFRLELIAKNAAPAATDAIGERPPPDPWMRIVPDGPPAYWTTLPVEWLSERMEQRRSQLAASDAEQHYAHTHLWPDAGAYLCNHVFFQSMHFLDGVVPHRGFIHVPRAAIEQPSLDAPSRDEVLTAGVYLVGEVARWLGEKATVG
jgi:pyroglutamyl-peptidase